MLQVEWPKEYWRFFETIKSAHGASEAGREFVRLLRLHSQHGELVTTRALQEAAAAGAFNVEVVMQIVDRDKYVRRVSDPVDVSNRPELNVTVVLAETAQYQQLIPGGGNEHCAA